MSVHHDLRIEAKYYHAKIGGFKPFEIRLNDRDFKIGDTVTFHILRKGDFVAQNTEKVWDITYITDYAQQPDYVVFTTQEQNQ